MIMRHVAETTFEARPVVHTQHAIAPRGIRPKPLDPSLAHAIQIAHQIPVHSGAGNHASLVASSRLTDPEIGWIYSFVRF